jgi:hypothetical protein
MKMRLLFTLAGLAISFALPRLGQEQNTTDPQVRQKIEAVFEQFQEAYNKHGAAAMAALHTRDAAEFRSWQGLASGQEGPASAPAARIRSSDSAAEQPTVIATERRAWF